MSNFEVRPASEFSAGEDGDAKDYWSRLGVQSGYAGQQHWNLHIAEQVVALRPRRVLELGCNRGRNVAAIRSLAPTVDVVGVDINAAAIEAGRETGLPLYIADEGFVARQPAGAFDVIFTVSVLDHIPEPEPVLREMLRASATGVVLLEPWVGNEGKVVRNPSPTRSDEVVDTTPYSYSWDYDAMLARSGRRLSVSREAYPLSGTNLGPHYYVWRALHGTFRRRALNVFRRRPILDR